LIEAKASGISAAQELSNRYTNLRFGITSWPVKGDKYSRALAVQATFSGHYVYAPDREWAEQVIEEMEVFPRHKYNDLTDSATQAIKYLRDNGWNPTDQERLYEERESLLPPKKKSVLYPV